MQDKDFINFINSNASKGAATFNLATQNASKQARALLQDTQYKALAKQHINSNIVQAYNSNAQFKAKLQEVMAQYNITIVE